MVLVILDLEKLMVGTLGDVFSTGPAITSDPDGRIGVDTSAFGSGHDLDGGGFVGEEDDDAGLRWRAQLFDDAVVVGCCELVVDTDLRCETNAVLLRQARQSLVTFHSVLRVGVD